MDSVEVAPQGSSSHAQNDDSSPTRDKGDDDQAPKKASARKRTKTGCLTCRKRRIKCDEARPTCANCIKSKRQCEGYNQRVVFKDPLGAFAPYGPLVYPTPTPQALLREQQLSAAAQKSTSQSLQIIAPKPPHLEYLPGEGPQFSHAFPIQGAPMAPPPLGLESNFYGVQPTPAPSKFTFFPPETIDAFSQNQWRQDPQQVQPPLDFDQFPPAIDEHILRDVSLMSPQHPQVFGLDKGKAPMEVERQAQGPQFDDWGQPLDEEDVSMAESEDEEPFSPRREPQLKLNELGLIVSQRLNDRYDSFGTHVRTFAYHADHDLATYEPSPANSPLNDKQMASVFWHFVNVTGPSMSLYERHPFDGVSYYPGPQKRSRQHIWSYTFPVLSLTHPALLQAILALGSLQIANLQMIPPTASMRHYHLALRRVARNVGRPSRRTRPSNLAATLLLAYYEVWNSDHEKWSKHLVGARLIIKDVNYPEMMRTMMDIKLRLRHKKEQARQQQQQKQKQQQAPFYSFDEGPLSSFDVFDHPEQHQEDPLQGEIDPLYCDWDCIDVPLLRTITGRMISYDALGMVPEESSAYPRKRGKFTEKDMNTYEQMSDLFWWYAKMDVYQGILGGTKLFMDYDLWTQCPPRAPMGRLDAIYGTYDHLMLLLGRLVNFASRDLNRKRRAFGLKGTFGPSGAPPGTFPGMVPASGRVTVPMGFSPPRQEESSPKSDSVEEDDLEALTILAYREWEGIKAAFEALKAHFGPEFEPLEADLYPVSMTPFGPALRYRTYSIAGIWMNYYMGMIVLHRAHPEMPPVAMMAAGASAHHTMRYAMEIARIAAGLEENVSMLREVSTLVGAAFIESSFCLFVAGVQYQAEPQRNWLVRRMYDITRLTGWQSARQIAEGCESSWKRAAAMGRGPPYTRDPDINADFTPEIPGSSRRIDRRIREVRVDEHGRIVLAKEEKAHYALGLLGVQEDLERLDLETEDREDGK
ncbi:hypothetical protein BJ170DRAFT_700503 [Xylariales sp. AK1849]|nr:hypothetical protein BJ170DRAFT_700503 [Xylariales sp. AK1849]